MTKILKPAFLALVLGNFCLGACAHKEEKREHLNTAKAEVVVPAAEPKKIFEKSEDLRKSAKFNTLTQNVKFDQGSTQLNPASRRALNEIASEMKRTSASFEKVRVSGFTDPRGDTNANIKLSEARANRVKSYLVSQGVPANKLEIKGKGPVQSDQMGAASQQAKDRRVDLEIVE